MKRADAIALREGLVGWLAESVRLSTHELCAGVVARSARLGDFLVIHEAWHSAPSLLLVAALPGGDLVFTCEWAIPAGEGDAAPFTARPEVGRVAEALRAASGMTVH
jgi:hypothetical protein